MAFHQSSQQRNGTTAGRSSRQQGGYPRNAGHVTPLQETAERVDRMIPPSPPKQEASNASFTSEVSSAPSVQQTPRPQQPAVVPSSTRWGRRATGRPAPRSSASACGSSAPSSRRSPDAKELVVSQFPAHVLKQVLEFAYRGKLDAYSTPGLREAADFLGISTSRRLRPRDPPPLPTGAASPQQAAASPHTTAASPQTAAHPPPITKHNVVQEIIASLKTGDVKRQDEIIAFIRANPKEAAEVAVSEQMSLLATSDPDAYEAVQRVLATFKQ
ncbi:hypothetical protein M3Y99_01361600 [Aphelenchoides fujianensis]|nr:hypothetical protein M3Y99_01361600 [Aphelenchoides fujianensis]